MDAAPHNERRELRFSYATLYASVAALVIAALSVIRTAAIAPHTLTLPTEVTLLWLALIGTMLWVISETRRVQRFRQTVREQQAITRALHASERRYHSMFATMADGVVVQDAQGAITMCNPAAEVILGLTSDQMCGRTSIDPRWRAVHEDFTPFPGEQHPAMVTLRTKQPCRDVIMGVYKPDETLTWILVNSEPVLLPPATEVQSVVTTFSEITTQRTLQNELERSLATQDALLQEVHHRVKNNLQVIASLLKFQAALFTEPAVCAAFQDSQNRVRAMVFVHDALYHSDDIAQIDTAAYLATLAQHLMQVYAAAANGIQLRLTVTVGPLGVEIATPVGLLVTELVSNALKHGFVPQSGGWIEVRFTRDADQLTLCVADNGCGIAHELDRSQSQSLGLQLVWTLTNQLEGTVTIDTDHGTTFTITFCAPPSGATPAIAASR